MKAVKGCIVLKERSNGTYQNQGVIPPGCAVTQSMDFESRTDDAIKNGQCC